MAFHNLALFIVRTLRLCRVARARRTPRSQFEAPPWLDEAWGRHINRIFVQTHADLMSCARREEPDYYHALQSAGLVRRLLIDGSALANLVNRGPRLQFAARPMHESLLAKPLGRTLMHGECLDPGIGCADGAESQLLTRSEWLKMPVVRLSSGDLVSVSEVVKHTSNIMGGVHVGAPRDQVQVELFGILSYRVGTAVPLVRAIGRVTARAMIPVLAQQLDV